MSSLHEHDATRDWLAGGLALVRMGTGGTDALQEAAPLLDTAVSELAVLPPPGVLLDLARVFRHTRPPVRRDAPPAIPHRIRPYEDAVLGRLLVDPLRIAVVDALSGLPERLRDAGLVVLAERILERVGYSRGEAVNPGAVRELARTTVEDSASRAGPALQGPLGTVLADAYADLVQAFQRTPRPLRASDVVVLQQLQLLERRSDRLALSQVIASAELLARGLPKRVRGTRRRAGHVSTHLLDDSAYPVGGFSSISTRGSIENLVTSELALMEDGDDIDLFDVRLMEGELLYYTRDETAFVRSRRRFVLTLSEDLDSTRYRDEGLPYQRLVVALGWLVALVRVLVRWLDRQDLLVRIVLPPSVLDAEANLLALALAEAVQAGWVRIERLEEHAVAHVLTADARQAPVDHIVLARKPATPPRVDHTWTTVLTCTNPPALVGAFSGPTVLPDAPMQAWRSTLARALADLV